MIQEIFNFMNLEIKNRSFTKVFILLSLSFCGLYSNIEAQQNSNPDFLITLESESGWGDYYSFQFFNDGSVIYKGHGGSFISGKRKFKISQFKVEQLLAEFKRVNFFSMKDEYHQSMITDVGKTTTSISLEGRQKKVTSNGGGPKELYELENKILEVIGDITIFYKPIVRLKYQFDEFYKKLNTMPSARGIIINYGTAKEIKRREAIVKEGIKFRGYDGNRVKFVRRILSKGVKTEFKIINANNEKEIPRNN